MLGELQFLAYGESIKVTRSLFSVFPNLARKYNVYMCGKDAKILSLKWDYRVVIFIFSVFPRLVVAFTDAHFIVETI